MISGPINGLQLVPWDIKGLPLKANITRSVTPLSHYHPLTSGCASAHCSRKKCVLSTCSVFVILLRAKKDTSRKKHPSSPLKYHQQGSTAVPAGTPRCQPWTPVATTGPSSACCRDSPSGGHSGPPQSHMESPVTASLRHQLLKNSLR